MHEAIVRYVQRKRAFLHAWKSPKRRFFMLVFLSMIIFPQVFLLLNRWHSHVPSLLFGWRTGIEHEAPSEPGKPSIEKAYLPAPYVMERSPDACSDVLGISKVALMFLTTGDLHHEDAWRLWFRSASGLIPSQISSQWACGDRTRDEDVHASFVDRVAQSCRAQRAQAYAYGAAIERTDDVEAEEKHRAGGHDVSDASSTRDTSALSNENDASFADANEIDFQHLFSVYVHAPPAFDGFSNESLWSGRLVRHRTNTSWGSHSLVAATRYLLWEAYQDPLNTHFVLLSESDVPLYDPLTMWQQLQTEKNSRVNMCYGGGTGTSPWRWDPRMEIPNFLEFRHWRKSSQWITLTRPHARVVLEDVDVYRQFEEHCWSAYDHHRNRWHKECFSDEHYFATLLTARGHGDEGICHSRGTSYTDWSVPNSAHPKSFSAHEIAPSLIVTAREKAATYHHNLERNVKEEDRALCDWKTAQDKAEMLFVDIVDFLAALEGKLVAQELENIEGSSVVVDEGEGETDEDGRAMTSRRRRNRHVAGEDRSSSTEEFFLRRHRSLEALRAVCGKGEEEDDDDEATNVPVSFQEWALDPQCFLTARKFPLKSKEKVKEIFLGCHEGNIRLLREDLCVMPPPRCRSLWARIRYFFKSETAC